MIADELNKLIQTKADIKQALIDKGQNPTDEFASYSDNIKAIQTGGDSALSEIGWNLSEQHFLNDAIEYAKEIQKNPKSQYSGDKQLVIFPKVEELEFVDLIYMRGMFNSSNLALFPEGVKITGNFDYAFNNTPITYLDLSNAYNISNMSYICANCKGLYKIKTNNTFGTGIANLNNIFQECSKLTSIDYIDTSSATSMNYAFDNCTSLTTLPTIKISSSCTSMSYAFQHCHSLTSLIIEGTPSNSLKTDYIFYNCQKLKHLSLPDKFPLTDYYGLSSYQLIRIDGSIVYKGKTDSNYYNWVFGFSTNKATRYMVVKDIGINSAYNAISMENAQVWGIANDEVPDARQSLIDSLITYSYDRAAAGYPTMTMKLHKDVKALLTEDEIAQITAKGYTLT